MCSKLVLSLFFVTVVITGGSNALRCNLCLASPNSDCAQNNTSAFVQQTCLNLKGQSHLMKASPNSVVDDDHKKKIDTYCIYLALQDADTTSALVERACGYIQHGQDLCETYKKLNKDILTCKACKTDLCN